ncbi:Ig-like domain-containing protein [Frondihabitans australicus]|uniref:Ig-like domain-containing protein n=1 Tax=Frondihabitans australicus TaxID=386892 RepID=A0A495IIC2_9MICO|nr:Ig-like domain-containing protein [Frondihabitans australicus]RKR75782.1 hypothetical protein C8E83_2938 [Frondihabitans australicus]
MRKLTKAAVLGATVAVAGIALLPTAANAAENVVQVPIAQGQSDDLVWSFTNAATAFYNIENGGQITFNAPANTTFPAQQTVTTHYGDLSTGNALTLTSCSTGAAGKTLTCSVSVPNSNVAWPANGRFLFAPKVTVAADATPGAYTGAASTLNLTSSTTTDTFSASAALRVKVTMAAPTFNKADNSSGSTVLSGNGTPGATINVKNAAGDIIGTTTVAADGSWSVDLGTDLSDGASALTISQSLNGETSPETTVDAADLPVINAAIAGGAGLAALLGAGAFLLRRRMA